MDESSVSSSVSSAASYVLSETDWQGIVQLLQSLNLLDAAIIGVLIACTIILVLAVLYK